MKKITLAGAALAVLLPATLVATPAHAASDVYFDNAAVNPSSFDCYYKTSSWHKLNDGQGKWISRSTPIKCDSRWRAVDFSGHATPKIPANEVHTIGNLDFALDWAQARKA